MPEVKDLGLANNEIVSVQRTSGTGLPGSVDTYTITVRDGTTFTFNVTNGNNGLSGLSRQAFTSMAAFNTFALANRDKIACILYYYEEYEYNQLMSVQFHIGYDEEHQPDITLRYYTANAWYPITTLSVGAELVVYYFENAAGVAVVPTSRTIAGLSLESDITVSALANALNDDFLDENSNKAVKNSALFGLMAKKFTDFTLTVGGYINGAGVVVDLSTFSYTGLIDIENGGYIFASFMANTAVAYYDENTTFISSHTFASNYTGWYKMEPPANAKYFRFSNYPSRTADADVKIFVINSDLALLKISELNTKIQFSIKKNTNMSAGYILASNGEVADDSQWSHSDFLNAYGVYSVFSTYADAACVAYYDENKTFISSETSTFGLSAREHVLTIPNNCKYLRYSNRPASLANNQTYVKYYANERIDGIEEEINGEENKEIKFSPQMTNGGYVYNGGDGGIVAFDTFSYSDYIECDAIISVYTSILSAACIGYYDADKNFISGVSGTNQVPKEYVLEKPQNAKYIRISNYINALTNNLVWVKYDLNALLKQQQNDIKELNNKFSSVETKSNNILSAFNNITCIGDSLTYSQVYTAENNSRQAYQTYPKCIEKRTGTQSVNLATSGATPMSWWDAWNSYLEQKDNQLAIIYLGTNGGLTDTLSTDAPENTPYSQWAETNTGVYAKIVARCQELGMKVLLLKPWITTGVLATTQSVIDQIGARFGCAVCESIRLQEAKYHYYPDLSGSNSVHYNDLGYSAFADELIKKVGQLNDNQMKLIIPE